MIASQSRLLTRKRAACIDGMALDTWERDFIRMQKGGTLR